MWLPIEQYEEFSVVDVWAEGRRLKNCRKECPGSLGMFQSALYSTQEGELYEIANVDPLVFMRPSDIIWTFYEDFSTENLKLRYHPKFGDVYICDLHVDDANEEFRLTDCIYSDGKWWSHDIETFEPFTSKWNEVTYTINGFYEIQHPGNEYNAF